MNPIEGQGHRSKFKVAEYTCIIRQGRGLALHAVFIKLDTLNPHGEGVKPIEGHRSEIKVRVYTYIIKL